MDTEILVQRLEEFRELIEKLYQKINLPQSEQETALEELFQEVLWYFEADFPTSAQEPTILHDRLLRWILRADRRLFAEIQQQIFLLQSILQHIPTGLAVVSGPDFIYQLATDAYRNALPFPRAEILGRPYRESWTPEKGYPGDALLRSLLSGSTDQPAPREMVYPDGTLHTFTLQAYPLTWRNKPGALILMQDTTQTNRARRLAVEVAEEARRQADELDAIITAMAEAIILFDKESRAIRANPAARELFGIDPLGMRPLELMETLVIRNPDGSPLQISDLPFERARRGETVIAQRLLLIDNEGRERMVRATASPMFNDVGISSVVTLWHDVTERESLVEQLEIEQSRLETIIEHAPQALIVVDEEARLVRANPAAERLLGRPLPYFQDYTSLASLQILYDDGTPYTPRNLPFTCSALDGERLSNVEMLVRLPDGSLRHLLVSTAPIVDRKGNLNGAVGSLQDITLRKQAEENLRQQASRSRLLAALSQAFAETGLHYAEMLNTVVQQVGSAFGDFCSLNLFSDDGREQFTGAVYASDPSVLPAWRAALRSARSPAGEGWSGAVMRTGQPLLLRGAPGAQIQAMAPAAGLGSSIALPETFHGLIVPLRAHGRWIGTLNILRFGASRPYDDGDEQFYEDLAERAALAIEDARLYEQESRRARELQALNRATTALLSTIDLETLLAQILEAARSAISAQQGTLYLLSEGGNLQVRAVSGGHDAGTMDSPIAQHASTAVWEKRSLLLHEIPGAGEPAHSAIIAPLMLSQRVFGALVLHSAEPHAFRQNDLDLLDSFAATATAALHNATLYAEVQRLATLDTLTEQYNRRKFFDLGELEMHRFRRLRIPLSVIMFDMDKFKEINDTYGHAAGDAVLRAVAQRCRAGIRVIDILARYGGDEFAILLPDATLEEAQVIAERIRQAVIREPIHFAGQEIELSVSLGVAQATVEMDSLSTLMARADAALYDAKQGGRNRVALASLNP